jgi:hypothetical protein
MSAIELPGVSGADFSCSSESEGTAITVTFKGNADIRAKDPLEAFLVKLHGEAQRLGAKSVAVDFRELQFMNSSCFKSFVSWIGGVQELPADRQYNIRFLSNAEMLWQRRSLHALRCFAVDLISIET